jgi:hypothetical protein
MLIIAIAVLSGVDETVVTTFDAQTGHQLGQSAKFAGAPLDIEILSPDWPDDNTRDVVTLSSNGFIRRFHHHELAWEATSTEYPPSRQYVLSSSVKGEPRYIATSLSKIYVVYVLPRGRSMSIAVATLDAVSGTMIDIHQLDSNLDSAADIQIIGSHSSAPLAIWSEKGKIKVNILGSKPVITLPTEVPTQLNLTNNRRNSHPFLRWLPIPVPHSPTSSSPSPTTFLHGHKSIILTSPLDP